MPHPPSAPPSDVPLPPDGSSLTPADAVQLLRLMGQLGSLRNDPRTWRLELLAGINQILPASVSNAFILKNISAEAAPVVVSLFDVGFKADSHRQSYLQDVHAAPFRDPFSRRAIDRFLTSKAETFTALRSDLIDDAAWYADPHTQHLRLKANADDCLLSLHRGTGQGTAYALWAFRPATGPTERFAPRERRLVDTLHLGLSPTYRAEESTHRLNRATELPPRLRQTLECLLAGDTERQVALKMSLSVHTVHDYVKALYTHFAVSSRGELLSKWMQTSGQIPQRKDPEKI